MAKKGCTRNTTRPRRPRRGSLPPGFERVNLHAAGIDVGATQHLVAVGAGADREGQDVRSFGAFTGDLVDLADWLEECGVTTVAMESTGVYWIPLFEMLESRGFEVLLVDPRRLKNVPGRKTDVVDCQWIQQLHSFGLLGGTFIARVDPRTRARMGDRLEVSFDMSQIHVFDRDTQVAVR